MFSSHLPVYWSSHTTARVASARAVKLVREAKGFFPSSAPAKQRQTGRDQEEAPPSPLAAPRTEDSAQLFRSSSFGGLAMGTSPWGVLAWPRYCQDYLFLGLAVFCSLPQGSPPNFILPTSDQVWKGSNSSCQNFTRAKSSLARGASCLKSSNQFLLEANFLLKCNINTKNCTEQKITN